MQTTSLGPFTVGRLALGAAFMGGRTPADEAFAMLDRFVAAGGNRERGRCASRNRPLRP
jgi:aryl-alcohol dehydrogenase-like predicted oxidoreductase